MGFYGTLVIYDFNLGPVNSNSECKITKNASDYILHLINNNHVLNYL